MKELNKTAVELINELELDNAEIYADCVVIEVPRFNQDDSQMYILVDEFGYIENTICGKEWWNPDMATKEYLSELDDFCYSNKLTGADW